MIFIFNLFDKQVLMGKTENQDQKDNQDRMDHPDQQVVNQEPKETKGMMDQQVEMDHQVALLPKENLVLMVSMENEEMMDQKEIREKLDHQVIY